MIQVRNKIISVHLTVTDSVYDIIISQDLGLLKYLQGKHGVHLLIEPSDDDLQGCDYCFNMTTSNFGKNGYLINCPKAMNNRHHSSNLDDHMGHSSGSSGRTSPLVASCSPSGGTVTISSSSKEDAVLVNPLKQKQMKEERSGVSRIGMPLSSSTQSSSLSPSQTSSVIGDGGVDGIYEADNGGGDRSDGAYVPPMYTTSGDNNRLITLKVRNQTSTPPRHISSGTVQRIPAFPSPGGSEWPQLIEVVATREYTTDPSSTDESDSSYDDRDGSGTTGRDVPAFLLVMDEGSKSSLTEAEMATLREGKALVDVDVDGGKCFLLFAVTLLLL